MKVTIAWNAFEPSSWVQHECDDLVSFLEAEMGEWPEGARLYHLSVSKDCDVTPVDEASANALKDLPGPFYVVVYPGLPLPVLIIGGILLGAALIYFTMPKIPAVTQRNRQVGSPNNALSERTNQPRIGERIADIYGTVRATPDLIAVPYKVFINNVEYEYAYMCLGRGQYEIYDIRDDTTAFGQIEGAALEVYGPNTSPISGDAPIQRIGPPITERLVNCFRNSAVNGQTLPSDTLGWVGPFTFDVSDLKEVWLNFVALNGMYKDDGTTQTAAYVQLEIELRPVDRMGQPIGNPEYFTGWVSGSATDVDMKATTVRCDPTFEGRCQVRARRVTPKDEAFNGQVVDEVKWRDAYGISYLNVDKFGDVTTVLVLTKATEGALAIKERKLNMLVTRRLPLRLGDGFTTGLFPTTNAADIMCAIALDPKIGNRTLAELDVENIYSTIGEVAEYFGTASAAKFQYTFDKSNISFEETLTTIADAVFCVPYRRGSTIQLSFEKKTSDSVLLFNHRNKVPNSETRTVRFGRFQDNDGLVYKYVSPKDDAIVEISLPYDGSAINPRNVESVGVRSEVQAHFHANRIWNKMQHQNKTTEFTALAEADLLVRSDRILVADNTRSDTFDGQVVYQDVLKLGLSQPFKLGSGEPLDHVIFLQYSDGTVEGIKIQALVTGDPYAVILANAPSVALSLNDEAYRNAAYQIVREYAQNHSAFILTERTPQSATTSNVTAINYDDRYYQSDRDLIDGYITEDEKPEDNGGTIPVSLNWTDVVGYASQNPRTNIVTLQGLGSINLRLRFGATLINGCIIRCYRKRIGKNWQLPGSVIPGQSQFVFAVQDGDQVYFEYAPIGAGVAVAINWIVDNADTGVVIDLFNMDVLAGSPPSGGYPGGGYEPPPGRNEFERENAVLQ